MSGWNDVGIAVTHVVLFANSPRVRRYFASIARSLPDIRVTVLGVWGGDLGAFVPSRQAIAEIIDYGLRRKAARPHSGPRQLAMFTALYSAAARLHYGHAAARIAALRPDAVGVWGGHAVDARAVVIAARDAGLPCLRFENGFLPDTTQIDLHGVNVEGSVPRDPGFYQRRGGRIRVGTAADIVPRKPRRGRRAAACLTLPPRYLFVPFQMALDSQVLLHSPRVRDMEQLFELVLAARDRLGDDAPALVFKEHPNCRMRYDRLHAAAAARRDVFFANGNPTGELIAGAEGVITLNSSVGTEALLLGRPVIALGDAIYGIPGVATAAMRDEELFDWMSAVAERRAPEAPLREAFLSFLSEDYLLPDRHQQPGPRHFAALGARLRGLGSRSPFAAPRAVRTAGSLTR